MNRRQLLAILAALPLIGKSLPVEAEPDPIAEAPVTEDDDTGYSWRIISYLSEPMPTRYYISATTSNNTRPSIDGWSWRGTYEPPPP